VSYKGDTQRFNIKKITRVLQGGSTGAGWWCWSGNYILYAYLRVKRRIIMIMIMMICLLVLSSGHVCI